MAIIILKSRRFLFECQVEGGCNWERLSMSGMPPPRYPRRILENPRTLKLPLPHRLSKPFTDAAPSIRLLMSEQLNPLNGQ